MKKLNKKGFTLVEMLVVIGIIAVLVAIVVPTVSSSTAKAAAATNAANLRSILAEATTDYLAGVEDNNGYVAYNPDATDDKLTVTATAPKSKKVGDAAGDTAATITLNGSTITVKYGNYDVDYYSYYAENGKAKANE